jgi:hypothetical protein
VEGRRAAAVAKRSAAAAIELSEARIGLGEFRDEIHELAVVRR